MRTGMHTLLTLLALTGALAASCEKPASVEPVPTDTRHLSFAKDQIDVDYAETGFSVQVDANFAYRVDIQDDSMSITTRGTMAKKRTAPPGWWRTSSMRRKTATPRFGSKSPRPSGTTGTNFFSSPTTRCWTPTIPGAPTACAPA